MSILTKIFGDPNKKYIKSLSPIINKINSFSEQSANWELKSKTAELKEKLENGQTLNDVLPEAFALVRESAKRNLNQRHFDSQLIGGIVLHEGKIAQMHTGEGKTLSATLPAYLNALLGKGVHIVTVNDYLAKRDMVWMGQIYDALGLTVGCVTNEGGYIYDKNYTNSINDLSSEKTSETAQNSDKIRDTQGAFLIIESYLKPCSKKEAYNADITYGTNNEFGFDYLRDNMVYEFSQKVQRDFNFAIVDEVDSILIDEARVPLIISGQSDEKTEKYSQFAKVVEGLEKDIDYTIDEKLKIVNFTEEGQNKIVNKLGQDPWQENDITATHQLESALKAKTLFLKDRDYVVKNNEILIIDEFTGRILPGRRWSAGLHQAVEAKEGARVQPESITMATITFQNYFRLYKKLSGMTGTALTSAEEFDKVYKLEAVVIPTNKPIVRKDLPDKIYRTEAGKLKSVVKEIKELNKKGQPVLVGTRSVEKNEYLGKLLEMEGVKHEILNAKNHQREGEIIAQAGRQGAVTIATNMAGRGVDIVLGGNPSIKEEADKVRELGGLYVLGTERHEARRIDNQLRGRSGRQGDPGCTQFFVSLEDDLMRIFGGDKIKSVMSTFNMPEDEPIQSGFISSALESAQSKIEGFNFDARHHLLEYDDVMNKQREIIYKKRNEVLINFKDSNLKPQVLELIEKSGFKTEDYLTKEKQIGESNMRDVEKYVYLKVIDTLWQDHLSNMDHLRDSVKLRAYANKDPLVEYKNEGHRLFAQLLAELDTTVASNIMNAGSEIKNKNENITTQVGSSKEQTGRNDLCPCGSGKKYKKCHGK